MSSERIEPFITCTPICDEHARLQALEHQSTRLFDSLNMCSASVAGAVGLLAYLASLDVGKDGPRNPFEHFNEL